MPSTDGPPDSVLARAVHLLDAFHAEDHRVSLATLVQRTGLPKSTVHRMLGDLVALRLVEKGTDGYHLGGRLFELGMRASVERQLRPKVWPAALVVSRTPPFSTTRLAPLLPES